MEPHEQSHGADSENQFSEAARLHHILETSTEYRTALDATKEQESEAFFKKTYISEATTLDNVHRLRIDPAYRSELNIEDHQVELVTGYALREATGRIADLLKPTADGETPPRLKQAQEHTLELLHRSTAYISKYGEVPSDAAEALGRIDDAAVAEEFLEAHRTQVEKDFTERKHFVSKVKRDFIEAISGSFGDDDDALLPHDLRSVIMQRFSEITVYPLDCYTKLEGGADGGILADERAVLVDPTQSDTRLQHALTHELFHAISGRTIEYNKDDGAMRLQRMGLVFNMRPRPDGPGGDGDTARFRWLNEAVTERLTMMLFGKTFSSSYPSERFGLDAFDIPFRKFVRAYFEEFQDENGDKVPAWKALMAEISQKYGPAFLTKLDHEIQDRRDTRFIEHHIRSSARS